MGRLTERNRRQLIDKVKGEEAGVMVLCQPYTDGSKSIKRIYPDGRIDYEFIEADGTIRRGILNMPRGFAWTEGEYIPLTEDEDEQQQ